MNDFLSLRVPARKSLLAPIIPERSVSMLYAPRGVGKSWLALLIGLAVATGSSLLRWSAPEPRRVMYVDGEMPLVSLQERIRVIAAGFNAEIPNENFMVLAADNTEGGIEMGTNEGQLAMEPVLSGIDLLVLDNLSTLCSRIETASDAWTTIQGWLELVPKARRFAVLINPNNAPSATDASAAIAQTAPRLGLETIFFRASTADEIDAAFANFTHAQADALYIAGDGFFAGRAVQIATLALRDRLPASYTTPGMAEAGLLMTYGTDIVDSFRQVGVYVGRVLKGANAGRSSGVASHKIPVCNQCTDSQISRHRSFTDVTCSS